MSKFLVVTADDYGLSVEVNAAVELAHLNGILTAASLMVSGPAAQDAIRRARTLPRLAVGLHLVLVDGMPTLPRDKIPDLVDSFGFFRKDMAKMGLEIAVRPRVRTQLRNEIVAQFQAFLATGLPPDHIDVHKHYHLHPLVAAEIICLGRTFGFSSLRVPCEPSIVLNRIGQGLTSPSRILSPCLAHLKRQARRAGFLFADATFGWAWSGALSEERMIAILSQRPVGSLTEIYFHPAARDDFDGHAAGYNYRAELEVLLSPRVAATLEQRGYCLTTYPEFRRQRCRPT
ncbi:MAG: hopanoid biosynthesis-associated protein HpnK [Methylocystis sp.]|uniref:hopanoid biosynthesis-associated protein HpnK n=1 Tax=Methylocystis sp. TaxID=1911079 RepID=UPI003DA68114